MNEEGVFDEVLERAIAAVHIERIKQDVKKITANHAVIFLRTSAVDVPNNESVVSPPKDAPNPVLLLSWINTTKHSTAHKIRNKVIVRKYKNVIVLS